jgi:D-arabinose 1-dehydrogenase-like Zn-dependent alcohol dehydrogenase
VKKTFGTVYQLFCSINGENPMANTMKAAVLESVQCLEIKEVPIPEIGDGEVLIKVKNTGICGTDWSIYNGWYSADKLPMIPGHEFRVIAKLGKNGNGFKGDHVTVISTCPAGIATTASAATNCCATPHPIGNHTNGTLPNM